jgi:two-component system, LytTR family, sensor histidine kinase AlgZ
MQSFFVKPPAGKPERKPVEIVIPDCCNIGIIFRVLLVANVAVLVAILLRTSSLTAGLMEFIEASIVLELACLCSLLALCGLRQLIRTIPPWGQRIACAIVPATTTGLIIDFLSSMDLFLNSFSNLTVVKGILLAALMGLALQHYFELRTKAFSPALSEARLQALQARIRPHFLFNSLNAVLSLIRNEPKQAEATMEDLADLFRVLLRDARTMTTLEDELRLCRQYLSIEKIRLGDRLQVKWERTDVPDRVLRQAQIPSLLLQPLVENAVHYGVEPANQPALIQIHLVRSLDRIEVSIINPYHHEIESTGNQMALANIRERLALLYDVEAQLTTMVARGHFEVRVRFPYVKDGA